MLRLYSKGCENAVRVLIRMYRSKKDRNLSIDEICKKENVPVWATRKIFQSLVRKGVLRATQGPGGGYRFKVPQKKLSLLTIVRYIDGKDTLTGCVMGFGNCQNKCRLHQMWGQIRRQIIHQLKTTTFDKLLNA